MSLHLIKSSEHIVKRSSSQTSSSSAKESVVPLLLFHHLLGLQNFTQAIQAYDKALAIDPNIKEALVGKGESLS
jgi:tetratricopeptide (TPR) repeat protein